MRPRGCGGIGRRARFRSVWGQPRGGSSPLIRIAKSARSVAHSWPKPRERKTLPHHSQNVGLTFSDDFPSRTSKPSIRK
jgi:hypothetical protein